jgi:hypothetical protein
MKQLAIACAAALFLVVGCTTTTPEAQIWTACRSLIDTEKALRPLEPSLSADTKKAIVTALTTAKPICVGGSDTSVDLQTALRIVRDQLAELVRIQQQAR